MKTTLKILSAIILGFILGWYTDKWYTNHFLKPEKIAENEKKIENIIKQDSIIEVEKKVYVDRIKVVTEEREVKIDSIKKLPLDDGIIFLRTKLEEYE